MNLRELAQSFEARFGTAPRIFRAPGRVNLIGEHTDYNEGFVMPAAVEFSTFVAISPRADRSLLLQSDEFPGNLQFDVDRLPKQRTSSWCDYVLGVATVLSERGIDLQGANLLVHGNVPLGAGLSSSAAIEVASALALMSLDNKKLPLAEVAKLCRQAENEFVGARVGIMDQFVSCIGRAGHALLLDCRSLEFQFAPIPQGIDLVVCNTMVKHALATGAYNQRREECEQAVR
jgi:galactokinase